LPVGGETLMLDELFPVTFFIRCKPALQASQVQTTGRCLRRTGAEMSQHETSSSQEHW
jgi:hypothetical protein